MIGESFIQVVPSVDCRSEGRCPRRGVGLWCRLEKWVALVLYMEPYGDYPLMQDRNSVSRKIHQAMAEGSE
jgi:hypothetical protein